VSGWKTEHLAERVTVTTFPGPNTGERLAALGVEEFRLYGVGRSDAEAKADLAKMLREMADKLEGKS
jgi:hypothetical protein